MTAPRDVALEYAYRAGWAITRHSPEPVAERLLEGVADRVARQGGPGVERLGHNLRRAAPGLGPDARTALLQDAVRSYVRYWHETFRMPSWSAARIVDSVVTVNEQALRGAFERGRGAIVALPHMGNWDLAGAWACLTGMPVSTVAERLRPEALFDRFVAYREGLGMQVVPLTGGVSPVREMKAALDQGRVVCLLADRDLSRTGVDVDLLGEPARMPAGPAMLSRLSGAPVVPLALTYTGPLMRLEFGDPLRTEPGSAGVRALTQQVADHFSAGIRAAPQDWHMLQRVFVADLDDRDDAPGGPG